MAIVEDEVRNESEEENEIEVVVEEDEGDPDSEDSDDDEELALEQKADDLEKDIKENPYHFDDHIDLIQTLWSLSDLDKWRSAFERMQQMFILGADTWLPRLQTEVTLAHSQDSHDKITTLFHQACLDGYSVPIFSEWSSWCLSCPPEEARAELGEVLRRAGADPVSGKIFWDAKWDLEKTQLEAMTEDNLDYKIQQDRVLWCLEEVVSRPLMRMAEAWQPFQELATAVRDEEYMNKVKRQHEAATDFLDKITPFEDKLLALE